MLGRVVIENVSPDVAGATHPAKAVVGERLRVSATVWCAGADRVGAEVRWRRPGDSAWRQTRMPVANDGLDEFAATIVPDGTGLWRFRVDAWIDPWATWLKGMRAKVTAGLPAGQLGNDLEIGALLLERAAHRRGHGGHREVLLAAAGRLRDDDRPTADRVEEAFGDAVCSALTANPIRDHVTKGREYQLWVDRPRALAGAWYEFFPRSTGGWDERGNPVHGTLRTAAAALDRIAAMGFDVVYLPPIHPIGEVNRKGRNNSRQAFPGDVGSPWAIGAATGGHDAIHPDLGTLADFDAFVARAGELGLEVALDLALQCAPDHPWVREHPEWFTTLPDGTIGYAENPPKRYEDVHPLDFDQAAGTLRTEVLRVARHWIGHGVRIFRVDNPHTKPPGFWHDVIEAIHADHPDVLFLSEAFTKPSRLYGLARLGFTQNYTYFTWRDTKAELTEFGAELVEHADESRPNVFVNTPDILPRGLVGANQAAFALRAALAATLSPCWGVYSGYELYENDALRPGTEEYRDSEKYQLRPRDFAGALARGESLELWLTRLNEIRRKHPALRDLRSLRFHETDNDQLIAYSKVDEEGADTVLCVVNLDPEHSQEGTVAWDLPAGTRVTVEDEVTGEVFDWGADAYVKLDPCRAVAHIAAVVRS